MNIEFKVIPHKDQRYATCGDYWITDDVWHVRVSRMSDRRYEWLVFLHELIECTLCKVRGVKLDDIDSFDIAYEAARSTHKRYAPCGCLIQEEPGNDKHAPYFAQHQVATKCERLIALVLKVSWRKYDAEVASL